MTVTQTVGVYTGKKLVSRLKLTTEFSVTRDKKGNVSVAASSKAENLSGLKFSEEKLATIGSISGVVQQSAALMGFGKNTTQLMTALGETETTFGTDPPGEKAPWKAPSINPLQLSGGRASGQSLEENIDGALDVFEDSGRPHSFSPQPTYHDYSDRKKASVERFMRIYKSIDETVKVH